MIGGGLRPGLGIQERPPKLSAAAADAADAAVGAAAAGGVAKKNGEGGGNDFRVSDGDTTRVIKYTPQAPPDPAGGAAKAKKRGEGERTLSINNGTGKSKSSGITYDRSPPASPPRTKGARERKALGRTTKKGPRPMPPAAEDPVLQQAHLQGMAAQATKRKKHPEGLASVVGAKAEDPRMVAALGGAFIEGSPPPQGCPSLDTSLFPTNFETKHAVTMTNFATSDSVLPLPRVTPTARLQY